MNDQIQLDHITITVNDYTKDVSVHGPAGFQTISPRPNMKMWISKAVMDNLSLLLKERMND